MIFPSELFIQERAGIVFVPESKEQIQMAKNRIRSLNSPGQGNNSIEKNMKRRRMNTNVPRKSVILIVKNKPLAMYISNLYPGVFFELFPQFSHENIHTAAVKIIVFSPQCYQSSLTVKNFPFSLTQ